MAEDKLNQILQFVQLQKAQSEAVHKQNEELKERLAEMERQSKARSALIASDIKETQQLLQESQVSSAISKLPKSVGAALGLAGAVLKARELKDAPANSAQSAVTALATAFSALQDAKAVGGEESEEWSALRRRLNSVFVPGEVPAEQRTAADRVVEELVNAAKKVRSAAQERYAKNPRSRSPPQQRAVGASASASVGARGFSPSEAQRAAHPNGTCTTCWAAKKTAYWNHTAETCRKYSPPQASAAQAGGGMGRKRTREPVSPAVEKQTAVSVEQAAVSAEQAAGSAEKAAVSAEQAAVSAEQAAEAAAVAAKQAAVPAEQAAAAAEQAAVLVEQAAVAAEQAAERPQKRRRGEARERESKSEGEEKTVADHKCAAVSRQRQISAASAREFLAAKAAAGLKRTPEQRAHSNKLTARELARTPLRCLALQAKKKYQASHASEQCNFCKKKGHTESACPSTPTPIPQSFTASQREFAQRLLSGARVEIEKEYKGMSWKEARQKVEELSAKFNAGNPWADSQDTRDRLRSKAGWWKAIGADETVMSWILCGARLPQIERAWPLEFKNHPSYEKNKSFVDAEIAHAVAEGTFKVLTEEEAQIVNPISVEPNKAGTKLRMCVDARWHNAHLPKVQFTLESVEINLADVVKQGDVMLTTDITRAYYSVPVVEEDTPKLAVRHRGVLYAPTVLPFGSSLAPFIFNKITRQVVRFARHIEVQVLNFYDDFLWATDRKRGAELSEWVQWFLPASGWLLNEKCQWKPSTEQDFLGFTVRSEPYTVHVSEERVVRTERTVQQMAKEAEVSVRDLESLTGQIASMRPAVGPAQLWIRELYSEIGRAIDQQREFLALSAGAREELEFWHKGLRERNGRPIVARAAMVEMRVDASETAVGAVESSEDAQISEPLPEGLIGRSSTERELYGVLRAVQVWADKFSRRVVRVVMDSQPASRNLAKGGGPVETLNRLTKEIWKLADAKAITLHPQWVPREENTLADKLSKKWESWYKLSQAASEEASAFAGRMGESLTEQWEVLNVPFNQIRDVVQRAKAESSKICVVHPTWFAQSWWPIVQANTAARKVLGEAANVLEAFDDRSDKPKPRWTLVVSALDFSSVVRTK